MTQPWSWTNWYSSLFAFAMTRFLLASGRKGDQARVQNELDLWLVPKGELTFFPSNDDLPSAFGYETSDTVLVGITGTDSFSQVLQYIRPDNAWGSAHADGSPGDRAINQDTTFQVNSQFVDWGVEVADQITSRPSTARKRIVLTGHSYGGAVTTAAAVILAQRVDPGQITNVTFGSPKVANRLWYAPLRGTNLKRWMTDGDPVPALPPNQGELNPPIGLPYKLIFQSLLPDVQQPGVGVLIDNQCNLHNFEATRINPSLVQNIWDKFTGQYERGTAQFSQHLLRTYSRDLIVVQDLVNFKFERNSEDILPPQYLPLLEDASRTFKKNRVVFIAPAPGRVYYSMQPWQPEELAVPATLFVPAEYRPKSVNITDDEYVVKWMGEIVCYGTRSQCKTFCDKQLKALKRQGSFLKVDSDALARAYASWCTTAQGDNLGFKPNPFPIVGSGNSTPIS